jgi:hypothetical protein
MAFGAGGGGFGGGGGGAAFGAAAGGGGFGFGVADAMDVDEALETRLDVESTNLFRMAIFLLDNGADANDQDNVERQCILHHLAAAPLAGAEKLASVLVRRYGANINLRDVKGRTPFLVALEHGNFAFAKWLFQTGQCDVGVQTDVGETALHVILRKAVGLYFGGYSHLPQPFKSIANGSHISKQIYASIHLTDFIAKQLCSGVALPTEAQKTSSSSHIRLGYLPYPRRLHLQRIRLPPQHST